MRSAAPIVVAGALLLAPGVASAHQMDELLQSAKIRVAHDGITIELTVTPGVAIAPRLLAVADDDRDGRLSPDEVRRFATWVVGDLTLTTDGRQVPLTLQRVESSSREEIEDGMGAIRLRIESDGRPLATGRHRIRFENAHARETSVYLVNALAPDDRAIAILAQRRDPLQRSFELDVDVASDVARRAVPGLLLGIFGLAVGVRGRRLLKG